MKNLTATEMQLRHAEAAAAFGKLRDRLMMPLIEGTYVLIQRHELIESIDLYNAAVELRDYPPVPGIEPALQFVVDKHLRQFEAALMMSDLRCGEWN